MRHIGIILKKLANQQDKSMLAQFSKRPAWQILIATILSARANDKATIPVCKTLFKKYNTLKKLANANPKDIKKIIKRTVYFNTKTKYIQDTARLILDKYNGKTPKDLSELMELPGVGLKVASCVMVYAHNLPGLPIDTHCHRISNRLGWVKTETAEQTYAELIKTLPKKYWCDFNELLVLHGQSICRPINPKCSICPVNKYCKYYHEVYTKNKNLS